MDRAVLSRNFLPLEFKISEGVVFREQLKGGNRRLIVHCSTMKRNLMRLQQSVSMSKKVPLDHKRGAKNRFLINQLRMCSQSKYCAAHA